MARRTHAAFGLFALFAWGSVASAQPLPESVTVGNGPLTVGFELKTTTHGDGPEGRTRAHGLMEYIIPNTEATWSESERAKVERWSSMSIAERTAFFFESYRGGHHSTNFRADTARFPFLDGSVSWYGSMNIPHIEVRSVPFDNPREAMETMERLKSRVSETIAFHMHVRFPDTTNAQSSAALTDWLRRVSWAIWLRRADYSSRTDFVLKAMDNQPINIGELNAARAAFEAENRTAKNDIIERRGLRVSRLNGSNGQHLLDLEFRGLMKDTGRLRSFLHMTAEAFSNNAFGPWSQGERTPFRNHSSEDIIKFRTFGWHGTGTWEAAELNWLANEVESHRNRFEINTRIEVEELREAVKRLATADSEAGKKMLLPSSFNWLFLPIEFDRALPEAVQEQVEQKKAEYIRKIVRLAERVHAGEFGRPGQSGYQALSVASRTRRILHDFVNETYTDGQRRAKLFEWYELSLTNPSEVEERSRRHREATGRNRAEAWETYRAAREAGEGFGPRRRGVTGVLNGEAPSYWDRAELNRVFEGVRNGSAEVAAERMNEVREAERAEVLRGVGRAANTTLTVTSSPDIDARYFGETNEVRVTTGLLDAIEARARELPEVERAAFRRSALGLILGHELSHASGVRAERFADRTGVRALNRSGLLEAPVTETDLRRTMEAFNSNGELSLLERIRAFGRYGTVNGRLDALARSARGEVDPLQEFRRADGTLRWGEVTRSRALVEGAGLAHFTLALFLKELAIVLQTGDRMRIEEFFNGLMTTDFYVHYGLFTVGARAGEVAYSRYLQRYVRPRFVNGILRTTVVLGAGLALPEIVAGRFDGEAFAISLSSLGLSSAAVKAGMSGIRWVSQVARGSRGASAVARATRASTVAGWFYTAAETAVVLYVAEHLENAIHEYRSNEDARDAIGQAGQEFLAAAGDPATTPEALEAASENYHAAWTDFRNYLFGPLFAEEQLMNERLERIARRAKLAADEREAALERIARNPRIRENIESRYGSLEEYAEHRANEEEAEIQVEAEEVIATFVENRERLLREIYERDTRDEGLLDGLSSAEWAARGGAAGTAGDPYSDRGDILARWGRSRTVDALHDRLRDPSFNRAETFSDELAILGLADRLVTDRPELAAVLSDARARVDATSQFDRTLLDTRGITGALESQ